MAKALAAAKGADEASCALLVATRGAAREAIEASKALEAQLKQERARREKAEETLDREGARRLRVSESEAQTDVLLELERTEQGSAARRLHSVFASSHVAVSCLGFRV